MNKPNYILRNFLHKRFKAARQFYIQVKHILMIDADVAIVNVDDPPLEEGGSFQVSKGDPAAGGIVAYRKTFAIHLRRINSEDAVSSALPLRWVEAESEAQPVSSKLKAKSEGQQDVFLLILDPTISEYDGSGYISHNILIPLYF